MDSVKLLVSDLKYLIATKCCDETLENRVNNFLTEKESKDNSVLHSIIGRFSSDELRHVLSKVKRAKLKPNLLEVLTDYHKDKYDSAQDREFFARYSGQECHVYQWAGDWWIAEDDNYVICEDAFDLLK